MQPMRLGKASEGGAQRLSRAQRAGEQLAGGDGLAAGDDSGAEFCFPTTTPTTTAAVTRALPVL